MLAKLVDRLFAASLTISGVLLVAITIFVLVEILLRAFLNVSTYVLAEFVGYALAPMVTFAMASTMQNGQLIRVTLVVSHLGPAARRWLEVVCVLATLVVMVWLAYLIWEEVALNWQRGAVSDTIARFPLWITPAFALAGMAVFLAALALYLVRLVKGAPPITDAESATPAAP